MTKFNKIVIIDPLSNILDSTKYKLKEYSKSTIKVPKSYVKSEDEIIKRIGDSDCVLLSWRTALSKNILNRCPNIKYIGISATTLANIPIGEVKKRNIVLKNIANYSGEATAEYIFTQLLMLARGVGKYQWKEKPSELNGKKIGLIGLGDIGKHMALRALGFNMKVIYYQPKRNAEFESKGLQYVSLRKLMQESDIISIHVPTNTQTLSKKEFNFIKEGAILINTSFGKVLDISAFYDWLDKGKNFAIFDMVSKTPQIKNHKNLIIGDQEAWKTLEAQERLSQKFLDNIISYLQGSQ